MWKRVDPWFQKPQHYLTTCINKSYRHATHISVFCYVIFILITPSLASFQLIHNMETEGGNWTPMYDTCMWPHEFCYLVTSYIAPLKVNFWVRFWLSLIPRLSKHGKRKAGAEKSEAANESLVPTVHACTKLLGIPSICYISSRRPCYYCVVIDSHELLQWITVTSRARWHTL